MNSKEFIELCKKNNINDVQIIETEDYQTSIQVSDNDIKKNQTIDVISYIIKAIIEDNTVTIKTECLDESLIEELKEIAKYTEKKYVTELPSKIDIENNSNIEKQEITELKEILLNNYKNKTQHIIKYNQEIDYCSTKKSIINTNGLDVCNVSSFYQYGVEAIANNGGENVTRWTVNNAKNIEDLNIENISKKTMEETELRLTEKDIKSNKYKILIAPNITADIISYLISMLSGDNVNKKISMLQGKINEKVFSEKLTIIEDPEDINSPSTRLFDDEANKTKKIVLVENGVIKNYLYDNSNAKDANTESTSSSYNNAIGVRNVVLTPGTKTYNELLKDFNGILIDEIMISSSAKNISTGIYSGQVFGYIVENGQIKESIKSAIINTSLEELLNNIIEISNESIYSSTKIKTSYVIIDNIEITGVDNNES